MVAVLAVVNALTPAISRATGSIVASADTADGRISTQIEIVHATGQSSSSTVQAWTKNVGAVTIDALNRLDVFFGPETDFVRVPQGSPGCTSPCWTYTIENDTTWTPTATLHITVYWTANLSSSETYYLKVVTPNGISDARYFTV